MLQVGTGARGENVGLLWLAAHDVQELIVDRALLDSIAYALHPSQLATS